MKKSLISILSIIAVIAIVGFGVMAYKYNSLIKKDDLNSSTIQNTPVTLGSIFASSTIILNSTNQNNNNSQPIVEKCVTESGVKICDLSHSVKDTNADGTREVIIDGNKADCMNVATGNTTQYQSNNITIGSNNIYCVSDIGSIYIDPTIQVGKDFNNIVYDKSNSTLSVSDAYKTCIWIRYDSSNNSNFEISNNSVIAIDIPVFAEAFCRNGNNEVDIFTYNQPATNTISWNKYTDSASNISIQYPSLNDTKLKPTISVTPTAKVDSNGCLPGILEGGAVSKDTLITINNINFCQTQSTDAGMSHVYNIYYYTFLRDGIYYTLTYDATTISCGVYGLPRDYAYQACETRNSSISILIKSIQQSLKTLRFN